MRSKAEETGSGRFADEWDAERASDVATLSRLKEQHAGSAVREYEADLRRRLGAQVWSLIAPDVENRPSPRGSRPDLRPSHSRSPVLLGRPVGEC
jgi:hypothetical protein